MSVQLNTPEEEALIRRAANGDSSAFGEIVRAYERLVYNTAKSMVPSAEDALDVSQETFLKLWRNMGRYRGDCRFSSWVYRVCVNCALDFLRREKVSPHESMPTYTDSEGDEVIVEFADESISASPERMTVQGETVRQVRAAIAKLSPEQREVIMLRDIDGRSYDEIAEMLGLEIGTLKSRLNRARGHLKELLSELGGNIKQ